MKILVDIKELTDDAVADLWAMHKFLKRDEPREAFVERTDYAQVSAFAASVKEAADEREFPKGAATVLLDLETVRAALREVSSKIGTGRVMAIVQQHGATSVSKLDPAEYSNVVAACEAALAEA